MSSADAIIPLLHEILSRLKAVEDRVGGASSGEAPAASGSSSAELPRSIRAFDAYVSANLTPFVTVCEKLGGDALTAGANIRDAWLEMRVFLLRASACKEPAAKDIPPLLAPIAAKVKEAGVIIKRNEWEKHAKTCSEGIGCLSWLAVKPAPRDFVENYVGGSDYWANGIRKEFRTTNPDQIAFCDTFKALLLELMAYIKEYHTTGVTWNPKGVDVSEYSASSSAAPAAAAAPSAAPAAAAPAKAATASAAVPKADLFSALNKEGAVTAGLKKVTKDMQTWRAEYKPGEGPAPVAAVVPKPAAAVAGPKGPAKFEFQEASSKWLVENQGAGVINISIGDKKETVYVFGCVGATIDIKGKCKSIVVDNCKKTTLLFDLAMASCEVVNCQRMQIHVREAVSAVAIDKTDGIVVHLPLTSLTTEVVASKSSEMNISWPDANGELIERPIPEQYVHRIKGLTITADVSDLYGH